MKRVIIFGGYGVFGSQVVCALAKLGVPLTIAGRNLNQAEVLAATLGGGCSATVADLSRPESCRAALVGHTVAVNCAGPFHRLGGTLLQACLEAGCHYADIADDREYAAVVRQFGSKFFENGLSAVYGCSSLPGISGALALLAKEKATASVQRARVTLFIGNNNPKGLAAVSSLLAGLGKPIAAPQGTLFGFCDREVVTLPAPFGRRGVFNFESPEYDLFPELLGTSAVAVKVGFELRLATYSFALLARLGFGYGPMTARLLAVPGHALGWIGVSGGAVMSELFLADGKVTWAALVGRHDAQRMAALPCALVAQALSEGGNGMRGAVTAYEFFGARHLLEKLVEAGYELHV